MRRLPDELELIPYRPGVPPGRRWLFLAPHPDDEVVGPGAMLAQARRAGVEIELVIVTDGRAQGDAARREEEARRAAALLGLEEPRFWRFADRSLASAGRALEDAIRGRLAAFGPELVLVTSPVELHPDHRALALAVQRVLRRWSVFGLRGRQPSFVAAYEVATAMLPNLLVACDEGWEAKRRAAQAYASQLEFAPYEAVMEALGTYRCLTLRDVARAEALHLLPVARLTRMSARAWASLLGSPRGLRRVRASRT